MCVQTFEIQVLKKLIEYIKNEILGFLTQYYSASIALVGVYFILAIELNTHYQTVSRNSLYLIIDKSYRHFSKT